MIHIPRNSESVETAFAPPKESVSDEFLANQAIIGNTITFGIMSLAIYVAPHVLEQLGFEVLK